MKKMSNKVRLRTVEELSESREVKSALQNLLGLKKPKSNIAYYMNNMSKLYSVDTTDLEKWLSVLTHWQNYLGEQVVVADTIRTVADSQLETFYSTAVKEASGTINEKKERARSNSDYLMAKEVHDIASSLYHSLVMQFENCGRGYALVSRILTKRTNIKEW